KVVKGKSSLVCAVGHVLICVSVSVYPATKMKEIICLVDSVSLQLTRVITLQISSHRFSLANGDSQIHLFGYFSKLY
ncbi:hypothetical protein, partial [Acinetobacter baumannii]|uniref:hypothetical protein n=1 Tax=Acinetobacter baumannii TaxID=470 RepID=UPI0033998F89